MKKCFIRAIFQKFYRQVLTFLHISRLDVDASEIRVGFGLTEAAPKEIY